VHVGFTAAGVGGAVAAALQPRCVAGERVAVAVGAPVTFRNLKTLRAVFAMQ